MSFKERSKLIEQDFGLTEEEIIIDEMNEKHAVVRAGKFYILTEETDVFGHPSFTLEGRSSFRAFYEDEIIKCEDGFSRCKADIWLKSPRRRKFTGIIFDPTPNYDRSKYNLWKGFAIKPKKGCSEKYWSHVKDVICAGNTNSYTYIRKWLAYVFQRPQEIHTALVLCGSQGTGKNAFIDSLGVLFGSHYISVSGMKELLSSFNFHLKNAVLVHANEALWGKNPNALGSLKAMITDSLCTIEAKGKDVIMLKNYKHVIISSNESFPVHLDSDDRRFFVLRVSDIHKEDHEYFKAIFEELKNGGYEALLYDLLHEDISEFNPRKFPESYESFKIKLMSTNSCARYIYDVLGTGYLDKECSIKWTNILIRSLLYENYKKWCLANGEGRMPCNTFGVHLKKIFPMIETTRIAYLSGRAYAYRVPPLRFAREQFAYHFKVSQDLFERDDNDTER